MIDQLNEADKTVQQAFSKLNDAQLNWKPTAEKWSIAQCLDHLIVSNQLYYPSLDAWCKGTYKNSLWQKMSPLTNFMGKKLLQMMLSESSKVKSPTIFTPSKSHISNVVERFLQSQENLKEFARQIENKKLGNRVISSPVTPAITLKVQMVLDVIIAHEQRHIKQALNVLKMDQFPS